MHALRLWGRRPDAPADVVRTLVAVQSQEFALARWSVAQRTRTPDAGAVESALAEGTILRTHVLRPTWHFVAAGDIRWMLALTAPKVRAMTAPTQRMRGLDEKLFARSNRLIAKAVAGGRHLTRKQLAVVLGKAGMPVDPERFGHILMRAELDAIVCSGAPAGKQHTYALLDERVPSQKTRDRDEAIGELTARYFATRGPATLKDFTWWSSLTAAAARSGLETLAGRLEDRAVDGRTYWFDGSRAPRKPRSPVADLVQPYDECIVSYSESRDVIVPRSAAGDPRNRWGNAILLDGRKAGEWRVVKSGGATEVLTTLNRPLNVNEGRVLEEATRRYRRFVSA